MPYVDTSLLVAAIANEDFSEAAQDWLVAHASRGLKTCGWTMTEMSSAIGVKFRAGQIDRAQRATMLTLGSRLFAETVTLLSVTDADFRTAARFVDEAHGLRGGDALHLAVASAHGLSIATLDRKLADIGPKFGVPAELPA